MGLRGSPELLNQPDVELKYCPRCGTQGLGKFCIKCGGKLSEKTKKAIYKKWWFWVLIIFAIYIIAPKEANVTSTDDISSNIEIAQIIDKPEIVEDIDFFSLYNDYENYENSWVRIAGKVVSKGKKLRTNYLTFNDKFYDISPNLYININQYLDENFDNVLEGNFITVVGQVGSKSGTTLCINNSYIENIGAQSLTTYNNYLEIREKAKQEELKKQKEDFIKSCSTYKYKDIARNPQNYKGKNLKFTWKVVQVSEGLGNNVTLRINVTKGSYGIYSDTVYCDYKYSENESKILEDDIVKIYGICGGDISYTSIFGQKITIPYVEIEYIDIL